LDPDEFADPLKYDIMRRSKSMLAFGSGAHHCLGQRLARMVLQTGLARLLARFPKAHLIDTSFVPHYYGMGSETRAANIPMRIY
jgi:cytochrome P450